MQKSDISPPARDEAAQNISLWTLLWTFLKIGSTAFGGFMALISVVQNYAVERKKLLKPEDMLDGISLATILPGPIAVNVVAYVGYRVRGVLGALVAAFAVILPSFLLILALSYAYFTYGQMPAVSRFFMGFIPAVTAIILTAAWNMSVKSIKGVPEALIALTAFGLLLGVGGFFITVAIIAAAGFAGWVLFHRKAPAKATDSAPTTKPAKDKVTDKKLPVLLALPAVSTPFLSVNAVLAGKLLITFAGMSVLLFGGGYVFIPLIQRTVVDGYGWVTRQEFIDGIALGQVTPGPILISAAFFGYKVAGVLGAAAATIGIFTPPAVVMLVSTRFLDLIKRSETIKAGLRGIRPAVIGMIFAASVVVGLTSPLNWVSLLIFGTTLVSLLRFKVEVVWIIPVAGVVGLLLY